MSDSSFELTEKGGARHSHSKEIDGHPYLTQQQEILVEASEPSFAVHDGGDVEANAAGSLHQVRTGTSLRQVPSSKPSVNNIRSVPNGGTIAWLQVLASFFLFFNSWGIVNTFGMSRTWLVTFVFDYLANDPHQDHTRPTMKPASFPTPLHQTSRGLAAYKPSCSCSSELSLDLFTTPDMSTRSCLSDRSLLFSGK